MRNSAESLSSFLHETRNASHLRVEADLGDGFVRLKTSEAERRQAAQDIKCSEDIVIELLRNARDAGARNIYLALSHDEGRRGILAIDDGCGIPQHLHEKVFEPRVTSKLDTAHMDKWGMHGRGMALYSIAENARAARIVRSEEGRGTAIAVETDLAKLPEKTDQSTFPRFELQEDGAHAMRGPKNILRTAAEFALEHRGECRVRCGSQAEVLAALYADGLEQTTPMQRAFDSPDERAPYCVLLAHAADHEDMARIAASLGLSLSHRTCRRINDGEVRGASSLLERLQSESFPTRGASAGKRLDPAADRRSLKLDAEDRHLLASSLADVFAALAQKHYLAPAFDPEVKVSPSAITITIPVEKLR